MFKIKKIIKDIDEQRERLKSINNKVDLINKKLNGKILLTKSKREE